MKKQHETEHYQFFFKDNDYIRDQIDWLADLQEKAYAKVSELLGHSLPSKILYTIFPDSQTCGRSFDVNADPDLVKPINAFCYPPANIHATFNETIKAVGCHEVAHLVLHNWLNDWPAIQLNEGLSVSCDDWWNGMDLDSWCATHLTVDSIELFRDILIDEKVFFHNQEISYPVSGVYSRWIIRNKGLESYKTLLRDSVTDSNAHKVYLSECIEDLYH